MTPDKQLFDRAVQLYRERAEIDADLAALKSDAIKDHAGELSKDDVADIIAAAALSVKDAAKKAKADEKRIRREAIAERLAGGATAKTAARVADERRRVEDMRLEAVRALDALVPHDADGVFPDDPEERAAMLRATGWHETTEPGPYQSLGGLDDTLTRVFAKAAPIRRPDDADLEECN